MMDLDRQRRTWRVREGRYYLFHLEPPLDRDAELAACLAAADERYPRLRLALGQPPLATKDWERLTKVNYWFYADPWPSADGTVPEGRGDPAVEAFPPGAALAYGAVSSAGILVAQRGLEWTDLTDQTTHEEVHAAWTVEVGEAPSLLNEGVATWFELRLSHRDRRAELTDAWRATPPSGRRTGSVCPSTRSALA